MRANLYGFNQDKNKYFIISYHKMFQVCAHLNPKTGVESGASGVDERVGVV